MFKEILDWVSMVAGILTVFAASATIYAVWIAHATWKTWKQQQNYSFDRDRVFELELATDQLYKQSIYYILTIRDLVKARLENDVDQNFFTNELGLRLTNWRSCLKQYDLKLSSLDVLGINYDKEILESSEKIQNYFDGIVEKMYAESDAQIALKDFDEKYILQSNYARELVLKHLREIRKTI